MKFKIHIVNIDVYNRGRRSMAEVFVDLYSYFVNLTKRPYKLRN